MAWSPYTASMRRLLLTLALLTLPLAGCASQDPGPAPGEPGEVPAWSFTDLDGTQHSNASATGSPTVLFFMATWCKSCQAMTDDLSQVHAAYGQEIDLFSVSFDPSEGPEDLARWKQTYNQSWPHGVDQGSSIARTFGVNRQSSVVVLDADGGFTKGWGYGQASAEGIGAVLDELLS